MVGIHEEQASCNEEDETKHLQWCLKNEVVLEIEVYGKEYC